MGAGLGSLDPKAKKKTWDNSEKRSKQKEGRGRSRDRRGSLGQSGLCTILVLSRKRAKASWAQQKGATMIQGKGREPPAAGGLGVFIVRLRLLPTSARGKGEETGKQGVGVPK